MSHKCDFFILLWRADHSIGDENQNPCNKMKIGATIVRNKKNAFGIFKKEVEIQDNK